MYDIGDKDALFKVRRYDLYRNGVRLSIDVEELVAGKSNHKFYAVPHHSGWLTDEEKYWGIGNSEAEALEDCLRRIKAVPTESIVPIRR
jgi:hypothetical protein